MNVILKNQTQKTLDYAKTFYFTVPSLKKKKKRQKHFGSPHSWAGVPEGPWESVSRLPFQIVFLMAACVMLKR